jgi:hypothetical protein
MTPTVPDRKRVAGTRLVAVTVVAMTAVLMVVGPAGAVTVTARAGTSGPTAVRDCDASTAATDPRCDIDGSSGSSEAQPGLVSGWVGDRVAGAVYSQLSRWVVSGARWVLGELFGAITGLTAPDLGADWLVDHLARIGRVALTWLALVYLAAAIDAAVRARGDVLVRAVAVTPAAVAGSAVAVFVLGLLTAGFDEAAGWLMEAASADLRAFGQRLSLALLRLDVEQAAFVALLAALGVTLAAVVLWVELLMREVALYLAASFVPLAVASAVWPATAQWLSRLARLAVALAAWKFVIVSAVTTGAALLAHGGPERGIAAVLTGLSTLVLAAFAPFVVLRIVNVFDADSAEGVQGGLTSATRRMLSPVMAAAGLGFAAHRIFGGATGGDEPTPDSAPDGIAPRGPVLPPPLPLLALPPGPARRPLPSGGGAATGLASGHIDQPDAWAVPPDGSPEPVYPEPPTATVPGGWWIVEQDGAARPSRTRLSAQPLAPARGHPYPPPSAITAGPLDLSRQEPSDKS